MSLNTKQLNTLLTGVKLAVELESSASNLRKFLIIACYRFKSEGIFEIPNKIISNEKQRDMKFVLRSYEIPVDYYKNNWDITDDELVNDTIIDNIKNLSLLEDAIKTYLSDFSLLVPEWDVDNLL